VISDEFMPAMLGTELLESVRIHSPETAMVLITGYPNLSVSYRSFQQRVDLLMVKPLDDRELRRQTGGSSRIADGGIRRGEEPAGGEP